MWRGSTASADQLDGTARGVAVAIAHDLRLPIRSVGWRSLRISYRFASEYVSIVSREMVVGSARTCAPARERRGVSGSPQATEPGCRAEPHV